MADVRPFSVIVMAAQRAGVLNPLAARAGVSHKCIVPLRGKPLIEYVYEILADTPGVTHVRVSVEPEAWEPVRALAAPLAAKGITFDIVENETSIADSAYKAAEGIEGPFLITTADNVIMTPDAILKAMDPIWGNADVTIGLTTREAVLKARGEQSSPSNQNVGPYKLRDCRISNCNLYGFKGRHVLQAAEFFREGGQFSKNKGRLVRAVGVGTFILGALKLLTLEGLTKRLSKRFRVRIKSVVLEDGSQAIDVDNFRTYDLAEMILEKREAAGA